VTLPFAGPRKLTTETAARTAAPTEMRTGTVVEVTARGVTVAVAEGLVPASCLDSYAPAVGDPVLMSSYQGSWTVLGRPVGTRTATDFATPGIAAGTTMLGGTVLTATGTIMASSTGSLVVVPRYRCTYFHPPGHFVLILIGLTWYCSVAGDTMEVGVWDAASALQAGSMVFQQSDNASFSRFEASGQMVPPSFGGRKVDLYLQVQRIGGTGTSRVDDAGNRRGYMIALDMGDQSVIATV
jgi:hypothetical protein